MKMSEFCKVLQDFEKNKICSPDISPGDTSPFRSRWQGQWHFLYLDYQHFETLFGDEQQAFVDSATDFLSLLNDDKIQSLDSRPTLWLGTYMASTACHQDSYGCNIVCQVFGDKTWYLSPPGIDTEKVVNPTRIPFEESSIFGRNRPIDDAVTLRAGDMLYVPRHWWHEVICVSPSSLSINQWVPVQQDEDEKASEYMARFLGIDNIHVHTKSCASTKHFVVSVLSSTAQGIGESHGQPGWYLTPTEEFIPSDILLTHMAKACHRAAKKESEDDRTLTTQQGR